MWLVQKQNLAIGILEEPGGVLIERQKAFTWPRIFDCRSCRRALQVDFMQLLLSSTRLGVAAWDLPVPVAPQIKRGPSFASIIECQLVAQEKSLPASAFRTGFSLRTGSHDLSAIQARYR